MGRKKSMNAMNKWLIGGSVVSIASLAVVMFSPRIVGATMGYSGDGIGDFFYMLMIGGSGFVVLLISSVFLLLLSLMTWIS